MFTQRLGIHFSSEDVKNPCHFECPHRLSDKLLKSSATRLSLTVARWRILRFPLSESTRYFRIFLFNRPACCVKCFTSAVSMEAHYRGPPSNDKRKNAFLFQPLIFSPKRLFLVLFNLFWQIGQTINHPIRCIFCFWRHWLTGAN